MFYFARFYDPIANILNRLDISYYSCGFLRSIYCRSFEFFVKMRLPEFSAYFIRSYKLLLFYFIYSSLFSSSFYWCWCFDNRVFDTIFSSTVSFRYIFLRLARLPFLKFGFWYTFWPSFLTLVKPYMLSCLTKEEKFLCLKYLGKTCSVNMWILAIWKPS